MRTIWWSLRRDFLIVPDFPSAPNFGHLWKFRSPINFELPTRTRTSALMLVDHRCYEMWYNTKMVNENGDSKGWHPSYLWAPDLDKTTTETIEEQKTICSALRTWETCNSMVTIEYVWNYWRIWDTFAILNSILVPLLLANYYYQVFLFFASGSSVLDRFRFFFPWAFSFGCSAVGASSSECSPPINSKNPAFSSLSQVHVAFRATHSLQVGRTVLLSPLSLIVSHLVAPVHYKHQ